MSTEPRVVADGNPPLRPRHQLLTTCVLQNRYIQLQEEYIKDEQRFALHSCCLFNDENCANAEYRSLKRELVRAQEEIKRIQSVPLVIGQFMEAIDQK